ncbi:hypothetical protein FA13DRAFT_1799462 [Coprinellus micaceus]|uniref:Uncharacterized protein n=1 Tax=Coprinellus micaceus TaxID=71717 RepID=A0A4Y7SJ57_COPMI|nr:hypothetical protein FA13DRAFT_1799462 [Coprinellus micaceus]
MPNTVNLSALLANSWAVGTDLDETIDAVTYVMLAKGETLPAAASRLSVPKRSISYSLPAGTDATSTDWRWTKDKTPIVRSLIREVAIRYHTVYPSAFFEAMEAVIEIFRSVRGSDREVLESLAVDAELLFVGAFFLITRTYYEPRFSSRELDFVTGSRYGAYLQPSPWLSALSNALDLQEEEADEEGLVRARTGIIADCRAELDEYRVLIAEGRQPFEIPVSLDDRSEDPSPSSATQGLVASPLGSEAVDDSEDDLEQSLSAVAYKLWAEAQAAEAEALHISEGREPPVVLFLSATRLHHPTSPSLPSSFILTTAEPTLNSDIPPSDSVIHGLPHSVSTMESLSALLADGPEDWREQITEVRLMVDTVQSSLHDTLPRRFNRSPPPPTSPIPSSGSPNPYESPSANLLEVRLEFPNSNSFASTLGSIQIDVVAPTPLLPLSVTIPEWMEAAQPSAFLSNGPSSVTLSEGRSAEPLSNPSTHSDLSTLVGEGYTIMKPSKPFPATTSSLPTGSSTTDRLAFCRGKSYRSTSGMSEATTVSDDSTGWLADGSSVSSLALHRVPNGPSRSNSRNFVDPPAVPPVIPVADPASTPSKFGTFLRRLRVWRAEGGVNTNVIVATAPPPSLTPSPSLAPERLEDWNMVVDLPDPASGNTRPKGRWAKKLSLTKGWFVKGGQAQMAERVPRA